VSGSLRRLWAVADKELRIEARSRERLLTMAVFSVLVAIVFSFGLDPTVQARSLIGGLLWATLLFAGMLGIGRAFALEREEDGGTALLTSPARGAEIFLGKLLAGVLILAAVQVVVVPVFALFLGGAVAGSWIGLAAVLLLGSIGFLALGTLFGAMAAHTRLGDTLVPVLLLPMSVPVVIFAAAATQRLWVGRPLAEVDGPLRMLLAFDILVVATCALLYGTVMEE
jgi:heme exporter protein B